MALGFTPPYIHPLSKPAPQKANPKVRQTAAAHHLGAPHSPPRTPQRPQKAPPRGKPPMKVGSGQKEIGTLNQGDIHNQAVTGARLAMHAELDPLRAQSGEIQANEQGAQQAYGKLVTASNAQAQHLQEGQEASAKTFQNQAAENALTAGKAIETSGQTQASMTGGYTSPELRAQMALSSQQAAGQGGAGTAFAQNIAAASGAELAQMRYAAGQRALGGGENITNTFQKQQRENQQAQRNVLGKVGGRQAELEGKIGQANFADKAAREKLISEGAYKTASLEQKKNAALLSAGTTRRGQDMTAATAKAGRELKEWEHKSDQIYKETHPGGGGSKTAHTPKAPSPKEGRKYMATVSQAEALAHQQGVTTGTGRKRLTEVRKWLQGQGYTGDVVSAAMNLAYYGVLGPNDRKTAEAYGLTPKMRANWFKPHK